MKDLINKAEQYSNDEDLQESYFSDEEKEVARKILDNLKGTRIIRATQILNMCKVALQFHVLN